MSLDPSQQPQLPQQGPSPDPVSGFGDLQAALQQSVNQNSQPQQPSTPAPVQTQSPTPPAQNQQGQPIPKPMPILAQFITGLIHPKAVSMDQARPVSRTDVLESFLTDFLGSLGRGLSAARGPNAFGQGFAASVTQPYEASLQRYQLQQQANEQQARIAQQNAQTQMTQQQAAFLPTQQQAQLQAMSAQPRWDPNTREFIGTMTDAAFANYVKGQGAAKQNALSKQAQADLAAGKVAKYLPTPDGRYLALDAKGQPLHVVDGAIDPQMMQRFTSTQALVPDGAGGYLVVPKTTVSGPAQSATGLSALQQKIPALAQNQTAQSQFAQKVPAAGNATGGGGSTPRRVYGSGPIFAYDPQANERVLTTPAEAAAKGFTNPVKVQEGEIDKYRTAQVQFNDVQANLSRYTAAAKRFMTEGQGSDIVGINAALNESKIGGGIHLGPVGVEFPGYSSLAEAADRVARSQAYKSLSPAGKDLVDGYFRTMSAVPAYMKALTGIGKFNKEVVELELRNIADPTMAPSDILRKLTAFQENVDQGAAGLPRMPGIPTLKDVRAKFESQDISSLPPNIQQMIRGQQ